MPGLANAFLLLFALARRLRDAADPGRQRFPGAADRGLSADHRHVRPRGRRGAVAVAAGAGADWSSCAQRMVVARRSYVTVTGKASADVVDETPPPVSRLAACWCFARSLRRHRLLLCAALLCIARRGVRRQPHLHARALPGHLHRRPAGDQRHADHRADRHAARRPLRRARRLSGRAAGNSSAGTPWSSSA